ncbi:carbamoyl-phosphate synthase large subunit [Gordonia sp. SID5947]|uniref:acetyl-CoA carboxylase family protein n=1 Tax=Gordonia sp. SID5947 TaxID=2690315 RepID=UPI00136977E6|nr:carboxyl transferase domain-containing protein [Gordonia sp. SID5947]MYR05463.1 carbamoyl-phosphate synthase large subunit [Gordonia sp. SID5947]
MKLLVANRGEIAVRIMGTAASMGITTVAIHPEDDAACAHVFRADEAVTLPGAGAKSYLDITAVLEAARDSGSTALHPGYGFLAENPDLARACDDGGITFVGPSPEHLELFGNKTSARRHADRCGVPTIAATDSPADLAAAQALWDRLGDGASVMVKAAAGGGGRGQRHVSDRDELGPALQRCSSEALAAFGDPSVYVEELLTDVRHIEIQVLGDGEDVVVLGDRDCSAQRRRQKLVEIAPAPALDSTVRQDLHRSAQRLMAGYRGLATVEFLVVRETFTFLEVNPRIQVEHTVTEETTGLDLVELGLRVAGGSTLSSLGLTSCPPPRGVAIEARVNAETVRADGDVAAETGRLHRFQPPSGRNIRVDTHGYAGYEVGPQYDSLLAKVIVRGTDTEAAARDCMRALAAFDISGVAVNTPLLQAILARPELTARGIDTVFVDRNLAELVTAPHLSLLPAATAAEDERDRKTAPPKQMPAPAGTVAIPSPFHGVVVSLPVAVGDAVTSRTEIIVLESMKMEHVVHSPVPGHVAALNIHVGDAVEKGEAVAFIVTGEADDETHDAETEIELDHIRPDLAEVLARHHRTRDEGRIDAVGKRHAKGRMTAREGLDILLDGDSFVEYGALTIAAQRRRRSVDELIDRTPADGLITGTGRVDDMPVAVMSYDYTVLAGTQGLHNHQKTDRLLELAHRRGLPLVLFAEGGGGRPGDTDTSAVAQLDVTTFRRMAQLNGRVPTVAVVAGYCFAGNAALAGSCDIIVATEGSSLGMGGPAMIEGGGLGRVTPDEVGPMDVQWANGVVDRLVDGDAAALDDIRQYLSYFRSSTQDSGAADQRRLRHLIPENRLRAYPVRPILDILCDIGSVFELRAGFGHGVVTALARIEGVAVGIIANNSQHLGGALDGDAADKVVRFLELCETHRFPVVSLCDTPGFMVGPEAERTATVRRFSDMFRAGARLTVPLVMVVLRKAYGLGAMAMAGGDLHSPVATLSWPTGEFGGMGLEGAVRLGYRDQLEAIDDPAARQDRYDELVATHYEHGKALNVASVFEIDSVIDPADTRATIIRCLSHGSNGPR